MDNKISDVGWLVENLYYIGCGLLPMALQGIDIIDFISGSSLCDTFTRNTVTSNNPAALLALMWHYATTGAANGYGHPFLYKDRLQLFAKYLQQLIMESIGKEKDLQGKTVNQGITVYGNKGPQTSMLMSSNCGGSGQFLRDLHRGARGPRRPFH